MHDPCLIISDEERMPQILVQPISQLMNQYIADHYLISSGLASKNRLMNSGFVMPDVVNDCDDSHSVSSKSDEANWLLSVPDQQASYNLHVQAVLNKMKGQTAYGNPYVTNFTSISQLQCYQPFMAKNKHKDYIEKEEEYSRVKKAKQNQSFNKQQLNPRNFVCLS